MEACKIRQRKYIKKEGIVMPRRNQCNHVSLPDPVVFTSVKTGQLYIYFTTFFNIKDNEPGLEKYISTGCGIWFQENSFF